MQPVVRALAVLRALAPCGQGLSLAQLSETLSVPQGSMHRILAVLETEHFITRSVSNRRYFLGPAALQLGEPTARHDSLLVSPHPALTAAGAESRETVFLTRLVGAGAICVCLVESPQPLRLFVGVGHQMPLHAAASARVLLAYRDEREATRLLAAKPLPRYTEDTLGSVAAVLEHLSVVRARGYDVCDDELDRGVWAVSVPVWASTGRVVASVTAAAPWYRVGESDQRDRMREIMSRAAAAMSADLGWTEQLPAPAGVPVNRSAPSGTPVTSR